MNTNEILKAAAAKHDTATLLAGLHILDAKANMSSEERMVKAATSDAITERHNLDDLLDDIFLDDEFTGTYTEAIEIALVLTNTDIAV